MLSTDRVSVPIVSSPVLAQIFHTGRAALPFVEVVPDLFRKTVMCCRRYGRMEGPGVTVAVTLTAVLAMPSLPVMAKNLTAVTGCSCTF